MPRCSDYTLPPNLLWLSKPPPKLTSIVLMHDPTSTLMPHPFHICDDTCFLLLMFMSQSPEGASFHLASVVCQTHALLALSPRQLAGSQALALETHTGKRSSERCFFAVKGSPLFSATPATLSRRLCKAANFLRGHGPGRHSVEGEGADKRVKAASLD